MRVYFEIGVFALIAVGVHAAGFAMKAETGDQSSGEGGAFLVSLQASNMQIEALVDEWTIAPAAVSEPSLNSLVLAEQPQESMPRSDVENAVPEAVALAPVQPDAFSMNSDIALPNSVTKPAEKPQKAPAVVSSRKPKPRPERIEQKAAPKPAVQQKKKKKPVAAQAAQQKQKAVGQGGQTSAGSTGKARVKSGNNANAAKALDVWGAQVRRRIERRKKSVRGLKRRVRVTMSVTVAANGQVLSYRITKSSGNKKADSAALRAVNSAGRMPKAVKGVAVRKHTFRVPMIFQP